MEQVPLLNEDLKISAEQISKLLHLKSTLICNPINQSDQNSPERVCVECNFSCSAYCQISCTSNCNNACYGTCGTACYWTCSTRCISSTPPGMNT